MHRATPLNTSFLGYVSGGARSVVEGVDDSKAMQESSSHFMANESRKAIEAPQNYGFTSVVMDATKDKNGNITASAETFVSFMGGNRSFPVVGNMDDRRYRLKELEKGDVAMFDHFQHQIHMNKDGVFITGRTDKKLKFQLGEPPQDDQQQSSGRNVEARAGGGSESGGQSSQKPKGQKKRYDKGGKQYLEVTKDTTNLVHDQTINYKTGTHTFSAQPGAALREDGTPMAGGPLVKIMGDKFTQGFGEFTKQVTAAPATAAQHLATKGQLDTAVNAVMSYINSIIPHVSKTEDGRLVIDGDLVVNGDLIVNGVVRAHAFERVG
ncbi:phage baseplate assembly protein [Bradyrhizobium sp. Leo170]|uniref:phage baseplate assembly protein domain-containing protein n=1 Tax=Bradyrhizobium sp. Leo170 TaxID=1571199 RepID=UPI0013EEB5E0|nr:phage baseplate assembly protein [Bradyrhizobium sp. Leo170]